MEKSRQTIEEKTVSQLENVRGELVTQTRDIMQRARNRMQETDESTRDLQTPLHDALLELTRRDGTIATMALGKRLHAYRKLVNREQKRLEGLFEQWADVTKEINGLAVKLFGPEGVENILKDPGTGLPASNDDVQLQGLMAELEAERERAHAASVAVGEKAVKAMKASEKVSQLARYRLLTSLMLFGITSPTGSGDQAQTQDDTTLRKHVRRGRRRARRLMGMLPVLRGSRWHRRDCSACSFSRVCLLALLALFAHISLGCVASLSRIRKPVLFSLQANDAKRRDMGRTTAHSLCIANSALYA